MRASTHRFPRVLAVCMALALALTALLLVAGGATAAYVWTSAGGPGADPGEGVHCLAFDEGNNVLYVGTQPGNVWRLDVTGMSWTNIGSPDATAVRSLFFDGQYLYAGTRGSRVYRNTSPFTGGTWTLMQNLGTGFVYDITSDGTYMYASTSWGNVFRNPSPRTTDAFEEMGTPGGMARALEVVGGDLFLATSDGHAYRNTEPRTGTTWDDMGQVGASIDLTALASDGTNLFVGTFEGKVFYNPAPGTGNTFTDTGLAAGNFVGMQGLFYDFPNEVLYAQRSDGVVWLNPDPAGGGAWYDMGHTLIGSENWYSRPIVSLSTRVFAGGLDESDNGLLSTTAMPYVTSVSPDRATKGSGPFQVVIDCANSDIARNARAHFSGDGINVQSTTIDSPTRVTATVTIDPDAAEGLRDVWVAYEDTPGQPTSANRLVDGFEVLSAPTWYLAEGTNAWGFSTYITVQNPNTDLVHAKLTYMDPNAPTGAGTVTSRTIALPGLSQATVSSWPDIGPVDFSTTVECVEGALIAVDRTMFWMGADAASPEGHSSIGAMMPSNIWYLPEGSSAWGFETWTLVQNPNPAETHLTLTYMIEGTGPVEIEKTVPAFSRATYNMAQDLGGEYDSSVQVTADMPVIAESSMYRNSRREGSCSIGATAPSDDYFLSEGSTAWGFHTYVLIQNPNDATAEVTVTYMTPDGPLPQPAIIMEPNSRETIDVNGVIPYQTDFSTLVEGTVPIIAERAMYWGEGTPMGEACHASIGLADAHQSFYLPDGQASDGYETYTLVQNPNPGAVTVEITYMTPSGEGGVTFQDEIPADSRRTYSMADRLPGTRASIMVRSLDDARPIMVERAMYWNGRGAGTDTIGGFSD